MLYLDGNNLDRYCGTDQPAPDVGLTIQNESKTIFRKNHDAGVKIQASV